MSNVSGKAYAITNTTPMPPWKTFFLRVVFFMIGRLGIPRRDQQNLANLSFIHFARWIIIPRDAWPRLSPQQPAEDLKYDYLMFCSNFNGSWVQYIDAFSDVIPGGMDNIWRWSDGYPGSRPITPFLVYIARNQYNNDYYYSAYPGASTSDVLRSLQLNAKLDAFVTASATMSAEEFEPAYYAFLASVQHSLGSISRAAVADAFDPSQETHIGMSQPTPPVATASTTTATQTS